MKHYFTLIELLIVIAILAILASMLLPAVSRARERGIAIKCVSTMQTLGKAGQFYAADANDFLPMLHDNYTNLWYQSACNANYYNYFLGTSDSGRKYVPVGRLCPKVASFPNVFRTSHASFPGQTFISFFGMNGTETLKDGKKQFHRFGRVVQPASKLLQVETNNPAAGPNGNQGWWLINRDSASLLDGKVAYVHANFANVLFFDGHVAAVSPRKLYECAGDVWLPYSR